MLLKQAQIPGNALCTLCYRIRAVDKLLKQGIVYKPIDAILHAETPNQYKCSRNHSAKCQKQNRFVLVEFFIEEHNHNIQTQCNHTAGGHGGNQVTKASERACFVGVLHTPTTSYIYVMGVEEFDMTVSGTTTQETYNGELTDLNNHSWKFAFFSVPSGTQIITGARIVDLPQYEVSSGISEGAFGAISLLKEIYKEQGMNAPVDYTCDWTTY